MLSSSYPQYTRVGMTRAGLKPNAHSSAVQTDTRDAGLFLYAALGHSPHDAIETAMDERVRHLGDILEGNLRLV